MVSNAPRFAAGLAAEALAMLLLTACSNGSGGSAPPPPPPPATDTHSAFGSLRRHRDCASAHSDSC